MISKKKGIALVLLLNLWKLCGGILSGNEEPVPDITNIPGFGCQWSRQHPYGVDCECRDYKRWIIDKNIPNYDTSFVRIRNCQYLKFRSNALQEMRNLRTLTLENIDELILEDSSLKWNGYFKDVGEHDENIPSLRIEIKSSNISYISSQSFSGRISEITIDSVEINTLQSFAFSNLIQTNRITMKNVHLVNVHPQVFKKFDTEFLVFDNVTTNLVPSRFLSDLVVSNALEVQNCHFETVRPLSFSISETHFIRVVNTTIDNLGMGAFHIGSLSNGLFRNNKFRNVNNGAFQSLQGSNSMFLTLENNTIQTESKDFITLPKQGTIKIHNLFLDEPCDCLIIEHHIDNPNFHNDILCLQDNTFLTVQDYKSDYCSVIASKTNLIIAVSVVSLLVLLVIIALTVYMRKHFRSREYGRKKQQQTGQLSLIVPDGRTYRETELHVIVEKSDLLTTDL